MGVLFFNLNSSLCFALSGISPSQNTRILKVYCIFIIRKSHKKAKVKFFIRLILRPLSVKVIDS
ncbi:hypothetical protein RUMHYD_00134 [Blautia hydrogenotrophica DSM 10507]|uniref:Uncharacterized protein n=1 Tax=Blautia hydrogenotrophica (strain DSM 10507 / JCM 14656 / S5a33) TaxID=476272 RepID=C0CH20_BLAHS|nr:hypothetical protein RUMHYD_00134 [Blautia hydrogenotrophica DSM 10507]